MHPSRDEWMQEPGYVFADTLLVLSVFSVVPGVEWYHILCLCIGIEYPINDAQAL